MHPKHQHPQTYDDHGKEVCANCSVFYINFGAGTHCDMCRDVDMMELNMDYEYEKNGGFDPFST